MGGGTHLEPSSQEAKAERSEIQPPVHNVLILPETKEVGFVWIHTFKQLLSTTGESLVEFMVVGRCAKVLFSWQHIGSKESTQNLGQVYPSEACLYSPTSDYKFPPQKLELSIQEISLAFQIETIMFFPRALKGIIAIS